MIKKRKLNKEISISKIVFIFILCTLMLSVGYSLLSQDLSIGGTANMVFEEDDDNDFNNDSLKLAYVTNSWSSNYKTYFQYDFTLSNISLDTIENWKIVIDIPEDCEYVNGWSAEYEISDSKLTITPTSYNQILTSESSITFGIQIATTDNNFIINKVNINGDTIEKDNDNSDNEEIENEANNNLDLSFIRSNYWGNEGDYYIQYDIDVSNNTSEDINPWSFQFELPDGASIIHNWNCNYVNADGIVTISPVSHNQNLIVGSKTTIGIQINSPILNFELTKRKVKS